MTGSMNFRKKPAILLLLVLAFAYTFILPAMAEPNSETSALTAPTRLRRPAPASSAETVALPDPQVTGILLGVSNRWWRNFRNPTFCPFIICGGSCANMMGVPIIGKYTRTQLMSDETPCSIESVESNGGCCMHNNSNAKANSQKAPTVENSECSMKGLHASESGSDCCSSK